MKSLRLLLFVFTFFVLDACQNSKEASNDDKATTSVNEDRLQGLKKPKDSGNIASQRAQALSIINYRLKNNPKSYALIEADVWEYQFVFNGEMSKQGEYDGIWIDFKPDFTYEYGNRSKVEGSGKYSYEFDRSELLMVDDKSNAKPQEWQVKSAGDALVLIGTSLYGDNAVQMKLHRVSDDIRS